MNKFVIRNWKLPLTALENPNDAEHEEHSESDQCEVADKVSQCLVQRSFGVELDRVIELIFHPPFRFLQNIPAVGDNS